ncbi:PREDICTED: uncharacterized protein LOC18592263 isoform X1 [Theobroma cacao]|uniref:Uncharacterized protein LOC18592263 isoform X1 n=1 Tax=Theobroma cacao TaxID=3641 RepID=A0AB32WPP2_THECC|nr:PREDICTED: uncharacterized protein LOC18592263 isoform X1 [Theobroma cacao]
MGIWLSASTHHLWYKFYHTTTFAVLPSALSFLLLDPLETRSIFGSTENVKTKLYELFEQYASNTGASGTFSHSTSNLPKQAGGGTKPKGLKIFSMMIQSWRHHCCPNKTQMF